MKVYQTNMQRLGLLILPTLLRRPILTALIGALMTPLRAMRIDFSENREQNLYRLKHNGQVCYLRKVLNDAFGFDRANGFEIVDVEYQTDVIPEWLMAYDQDNNLRNEIRVVRDTPPTIIFDEQYINRVSNNFYVLYPASLSADDLTRAKRLVNTYKLVSRTASYKPK